MSDTSEENMNKLLKRETATLEQNRFSWEVANFADLFDIQEDGLPRLPQQVFEFKMGHGINLPTDWRITLDLHYMPRLSKVVWMQLQLKKKPDICDEVNVTFHIQIRNKNGDGFYYKSIIRPQRNLADIKNLELGITHLMRLPIYSEIPFTDDGSLIFEIHVDLYAPKTTLNLATRLLNFNAISTKKQQSDMANMLLENWSCRSADSPTKIYCKDGVVLGVNRGILSARSPVFLGMFQHDTKEALTGVVQVKEISSAPMKVLLHFLYTGLLQDNWSSPGIVEELLYAAGKYEQLDLIEFMNGTLGLVCTEDNVGKLANLAKKFDMTKATEDLFKFIDIHGTNYDKLESMMRNAIISDWYMVPLAEDVASGEDVMMTGRVVKNSQI